MSLAKTSFLNCKGLPKTRLSGFGHLKVVASGFLIVFAFFSAGFDSNLDRVWGAQGGPTNQFLRSWSLLETSWQKDDPQELPLTRRDLPGRQFFKSISTIYCKYRYGMRVLGPKCRFLSIGLALAGPNFLPPSCSFLIARVKSCFCIGKYGMKSTSTFYAWVNALHRFLYCLELFDVDFVSISIDRIGPWLELVLTIHRKMRYEMKVSVPKYRFLSIGVALLQPSFSLYILSSNFSS